MEYSFFSITKVISLLVLVMIASYIVGRFVGLGFMKSLRGYIKPVSPKDTTAQKEKEL